MKAKNRRGSADGQSQDVLGPLQDLVRQLRSGVRTKQQLVDFNEGRNPFAKKVEVLVLVPLKEDKSKDGWKRLEDVSFDGQQFVPEIVELLKPGEASVNGKVMRLRAKEFNAYLGQGHAEYLLENQHLIPSEWRGNYLAFPGTLWQDLSGDRHVPCLSWDGDRWYLCFDWLTNDWHSDDRLVCLRKPACR